MSKIKIVVLCLVTIIPFIMMVVGAMLLGYGELLMPFDATAVGVILIAIGAIGGFVGTTTASIVME